MSTVTVRHPTFARYRRLFWRSKGKSILRCLEYERFSMLSLSGRILDFGGGDKTNYSNEINGWGDSEQGYVYESANIDQKTEPTYLIGQDGKILVESDRYDAVISLNTFEHVCDLHSVFTEIHRVLKPGGRLIFIVPFIFRVHSHPDDYLRGTPSFWEKTLDDYGFGGIDIETINWGPFSTASTVSGLPGPFKSLRRHLALLMDVAYFAMRHGQDVVSHVEHDAPICNAPLGYFICSNKR